MLHIAHSTNLALRESEIRLEIYSRAVSWRDVLSLQFGLLAKVIARLMNVTEWVSSGRTLLGGFL
jgi:hypothetical protein